MTIDYAEKIEREFLFVEGSQQTVFDMAMLIDVSAGNDPKRQQRIATITCFKY